MPVTESMKKRLFNQQIRYSNKRSHEDLEPGEAVFPPSAGRFKGVSIGRGRNGYFIFTHRVRSQKVYEKLEDIPDYVIEKVQATS